ncbi:uncharacterized protein [Emydura macquarii macquarii]|uniref:uncharacterized protein n=1 Tax=Emydura macquarii macquarii TaxID=1129001 RepID=UPI003529F6C4
MGKPLSRPDCLRQNPPCVGKGEEDEDLNIEDCYVPQRSIYDTVRLNEQIDSGSKGSLSSRHFTDRTLPYSHRTLDISTLCPNGALTSSSVFELRGREVNKLDEKMIFDALKLNSDIIRTAGLPKIKSHTEKKEHRRSWRMFVPPNFADCANKSECSVVETADRSDIAKAGKCKWGTNSLTSEEDDSGLCSPPTEREEKQDTLLAGEQTQIRSISSAEYIHVVDQFRQFFPAISNSEQHIPLLDCSSAPVEESCRLTLHDVSQSEKRVQSSPQKCENEETGTKSCYSQNSFKEGIISDEEHLQGHGGNNNFTSDKEKVENEYGVEEVKTHVTMVEGDCVADAPQHLDMYYANIAVNTSDTNLAKCEILSDAEESSITHTDSIETTFSAQELELDNTINCPQANPMRMKGNVWTTGTPRETLDTVCNGLLSNKVIQNKRVLESLH